MQTKEKKWADVENYLQGLYEENEELFYKMQELKLTVEGEVKIQNVMSDNEKLKKQNKGLKSKLAKIRKRLTDPYFLQHCSNREVQDAKEKKKTHKKDY